MGITRNQLQKMAVQINQVVDLIQQQDADIVLPQKVCPMYKESAKNLIHYAAFRSFDARKMQEGLKYLGLTRLANSEGNILGSLINLKIIIHSLLGDVPNLSTSKFLSIGDGKKLLTKHTDQLFGDRNKERRVRIMVTQPSEAATNYNMVLEMVKSGMDCARINCAHDNPETWKAIVNNVQKAAEACSTTVKVAMDLAGPKIRTGNIGLGPKIKRFQSQKNSHGTKGPVFIKLVKDDKAFLENGEVPVDQDWMSTLRVGDKLKVKDSRGKSRKLIVVQIEADSVLLASPKTIYLKTGTTLKPLRKKLKKVKVGEFPGIEQFILLREGDVLTVSGKGNDATLPEINIKGELVKPGIIGCVPPQIVGRMEKGAPVLFDDGKIAGEIIAIGPESFQVKIIRAKEGGAKLKAEKGMNFPTLDLGISGLTDKDREDLKFVVDHADIVNFSYVNDENDVRALLAELERLGANKDLGVILKIETNLAYKNLIPILLTAMQRKHLGVMIARGDLALEVGWKNMGMVQEGILSFCSAAHIPVVWATQVLEGLAKKGMPSRSEITDITSSVQAECVMLNKGPHINEAISFLDEVLYNIESSHDKKEVMLPIMQWK